MNIITSCHIFLLKYQIPFARNKISRLRGNQRERGKVVAHYSKKGVAGMPPSLETMLDKVYDFRRGVLQRRLNAELICVVVFFS